MTVHVFVEGGGSQNRTRTECRKAFRLFFEKLLGNEDLRPRISACGSRNEAYHDFCRSLRDRDIFPILLVDSEDPIPAGKTTCQHLQDRDHWTHSMPDRQVHLMVQCMEAWFLADRASLEKYYGHGFKSAALPGGQDIERVPKRDVMDGLARATRDTDKGEYHKTRHGFPILERIDPAMVRDRSLHARAFLEVLLSQLK